MIISSQWINELLKQSFSAADIADHLSQTGFESELLDDNVNISTDLVVGEVTAVEPHPNASKLNICQVNIGSEVLQIVCGCPTVVDAKFVIVAPVGTTLPKIEIKAAELRGVASNGMICALGEIGFEIEQKGIFHIQQDCQPGQSLTELIQGSKLIDVDLTPNRGDCASAFGLVRDYAASANLALPMPGYGLEGAPGKLLNMSEKAVTNFSAAKVSVNIQKSLPLEMTQRLQQSGIKLINPVVDLLNYVMIYLGQPMHAYDANCVELPLSARFSNGNERLDALDDQTYDLNKHDLTIYDRNGPIGLAGVIGGSDSKVTSATKEVILESATFDAASIAKTLRNTHIHTDAAYRFERGVSPDLNELALAYALTMMKQYLDAEVLEIDTYSTKLDTREVVTGVEWLNSYLGSSLSKEQMQSYLNRLKIDTMIKDDQLVSILPVHRLDMHEQVDIAEEVARIHGYNQIPLSPMVTELKVSRTKSNVVTDAKRYLCQLGMQEVVTYSYTSPKLIELIDPNANTFEIQNPIHSDMNLMRTNLWQTMIPVLQYNRSRQQSQLQLFEAAHIFLRGENNEPREVMMLAGLMNGISQRKSYLQEERNVDYYDVQNAVENLLYQLGYQCQFIAKKLQSLHPHQGAVIVVGDVEVGSVGKLHPQLCAELDIENTFGFSINMDALPEQAISRIEFPSKYPSITRDVTIECPADTHSALLIEQWSKLDLKNLRDIQLIDCYLHDHKKSLTYQFIFQSNDGTCSDSEVQSAIDQIIAVSADLSLS
jgi:phenylalanyl-tRNA synthetase beta chain